MLDELDSFAERVKGRRDKEGTLKNRLSDIECFRQWCISQNVDDISGIEIYEIEDYLTYLGQRDYAASVVDRRWWTLNILFNELVARDKIQENPLNKIDKSHYKDLFSGSKKSQYIESKGGIFALDEDGVNELVDNVPNPVSRNRLIINLLYHTGVRRQELADIKLENIDLKERRIEIYSQKQDSQYSADDPWRPVWYGKSIDMLMDQWIRVDREGYATSGSPYLFVGTQTDRLSGYRINEIVKESAENAGIQKIMYTDAFIDEENGVTGRKKYLITSHTLRHSFAKACMTPDDTGARIDVKSLAELMGHSDSSVTAEKYLHFAEDDIKEARGLYGPR